MIPAETAFARTPFFAHSIASDLVAAFNAPLVRDASTLGTLDRLVYQACRDCHDVTPPLLVHDLHSALSHVEEARDVRCHVDSVVILCVGGEGLCDKDAGVIDQRVDAAKVF